MKEEVIIALQRDRESNIKLENDIYLFFGWFFQIPDGIFDINPMCS